MEETIELRDWLIFLKEKTRIIILLPLIIMAGVSIVCLLLPPVYETQCGILLLESEVKVAERGEKFHFLLQETLIALGKNPIVRKKAVDKAIETFDQNSLFFERLLKKMDFSYQGNLIVIKIRGQKREIITQLINWWGKFYLEYLKDVYGWTESKVKLAYAAELPSRPLGKFKSKLVILAGLVSFMFTLGWVCLAEYSREIEKRSEKNS
jgi:capsular polysaccharide biosynthesis protein